MTKKLIDIGGYRLCVQEYGSGNYTVVFESPMGESLRIWGTIQEKISKFAHTICYDRGGIGNSEESTAPRFSETMAKELHQLLKKLGKTPPYLFVGASYGCYVIRAFSALYPQEVEGILFVEPTHEDYIEGLKKNRTKEAFAQIEELWEITSVYSKRGYLPEWKNFQEDSKFIKKLQFPQHVPITILSSVHWGEGEKILMQLTHEDINMRCGLHKRWALEHKNVKHIITEKSGHNIAQEEPELVIELIIDLIYTSKNIQAEG